MRTLTTLRTLALSAMAVALFAGSVSAEMKKVRIGTEGAYAPFNYIDSNGKLVGFDVDIAKALCEAAQFDCEFVVQDWDGIIPGLLAKKYDAIVASMSITEERKKMVDFTNKYYQTPARFAARKGSDFDVSRTGLVDKLVGVQRATTHEKFLRDNFPNADVKVYATQDEANADLIAGRLDLVMANSVALDESLLKTEEGQDFEFVGPGYAEPKWHGEGVGIALRKEDDELREALNAAIEKIRADGTYQEIQSKYFTFDVYGKPTS